MLEIVYEDLNAQNCYDGINTLFFEVYPACAFS